MWLAPISPSCGAHDTVTRDPVDSLEMLKGAFEAGVNGIEHFAANDDAGARRSWSEARSDLAEASDTQALDRTVRFGIDV